MKTIITFAAVAVLAACTNTPKIDQQLTTLAGHVEKSSSLRGSFCNGQPYRWYYEGKTFIAGTCQNGMVFHLPLVSED